MDEDKIYFAHKLKDGTFEFIFDSELKVKLCFPDLKSHEGKIVPVKIVEA